VPAIEAETGVRRGRVELMLKQLAVDGAVDRVEQGWLRTDQEWTYSAEHYDGVVAVRRREAAIMREYTEGARCLMQLLQESLDDPEAAPCGRCSVCRDGLPEGLAAAPDPESVARVSALLRGEVHVVEPRKMWPGGAFGSRGRIPAGELAAPGRALIFADAPEWRETVRALLADGVPDAPASPELLEAAVRSLGQWRQSWPARPEVVIDLAAAGRPALTASVADHLAELGRLERASLGQVATAPSDLSSADEAAYWRDQLAAAALPAVEGRAVLLVVDATSSLWPVTVAASSLRRAGAGVVLPLVVHRRP
jgi:ATP-dependent DNA helicase RecQ